MRARTFPFLPSSRLSLPARALALTSVASLLVFAGCANDGDTQVMAPVVLGMLDTAGPTYDDGQVQMYQVQKSVELPMRQPTGDERPKGQSDPYARPPFNLASDTRITVRFTLTNLDETQHSLELLVDPWNEFVRYVPGLTTDSEDEAEPNFSGIDRFYILPPKGRIEGILTPDDMVELATDLGTAMKLQKTPPAADSAFGGPVLYNRAFNVQNRSSEPDPVLAPYIPKVVAGLVGFDLGLRTYEPAKIAVEIVVDVQDVNGERVVKPGDSDKSIGRPGGTLTPPAAARQ
ncbi:hypothetical protein AKJ09_03269 [Labilithrix luteola]|uniref:Lipoprotein n=1 Tax=Labilithrix luteola TaxID=1391654 RepID=A0A0K1PST5_9BACT|nr:hypothetical protein [Labilithrix luteola]AKU96605.1 hypothetical protein AKJ09_03269 [Labilithrix luteola]